MQGRGAQVVPFGPMAERADELEGVDYVLASGMARLVA